MPEEENKEENKTEEAKPEPQPKQEGVTLEKLDTRLRAVEEVLRKEQKL